MSVEPYPAAQTVSFGVIVVVAGAEATIQQGQDGMKLEAEQ